MVLRAEYILLISLAILFGFIITQKPNSVMAIEANSTKEVYFKNFSLIELTQTGVENQLISSEAIKYKKGFHFKDINITYRNSHYLLAKKALYRENFIYLEDNISLRRNDGLFFKSDNLEYSLKEKVLRSNSDFKLDINGSIVQGNNLYYNLDTKRLTAQNIMAFINIESIE